MARATERPASCASRPRASLTHRQTQAQNQFGDDYIVDYWGFSDVGKAGGAAVSPFGQFAVDEAYRRRE